MVVLLLEDDEHSIIAAIVDEEEQEVTSLASSGEISKDVFDIFLPGQVLSDPSTRCSS